MKHRVEVNDEIELSIVMPCLNEEQTLGICIEKAASFLEKHQVQGEIVIADNGSTDRSVQIAEELGARVVHVEKKGYGRALKAGFDAAAGKYIIMGDSDDSYDLENLMPFLEKLREGFDLVMGNRFAGGIATGAMPWHHKYIGNPVLSFVGRLFFRTPIRDFHCGLRGFSKEAYLKMNLQTTGMEFATEIVIKSVLNDLSMCEVPTTLSPDGRDRPPHLRSWRDGWRHLKFMLIFSPKWLFLYPGLALMLVGALLAAMIFASPLQISGINFDLNTMLYACSLVLIGFNGVFFAVMARAVGVQSGLMPESQRLKSFQKVFTLEVGLLVSVLLWLVGLGMGLWVSLQWRQTGFGALTPDVFTRVVIPSATLLVLGSNLLFGSFFLSTIEMGTIAKD